MEIFPIQTNMNWKNRKIPRFDVNVQKSGTKKRKTIITHAYPEWEMDCSFVGLNKKQIDEMAGFFMSVYGQARAFLWPDPEDYKQSGTRFGIGDGVTKRFQLLRSWDDRYYDPVTDPIPDTLVIYKNDVRQSATLEDDGIIYFSTAPAAGVILSADFHYYWRVAFDNDISWDIVWYNLYELNNFKLVSVR